MIQDVVKACIAAGFTGDGLVEIVAIAGRESQWDAQATDDTRRYTQQNADGTWTDPQTGESLPAGISPEYSVGVFQLNLLAHTTITEADARDYGRAAYWAYQLSQGGTDFSPWSTEAGLSDALRQEAREAISAVEAANSGGGNMPATVTLDEAQATVALQAALQLVSHGDPVQLSEGPAADQVTITFTVPRVDLFNAWPDMATVLPQ